MSSAQEIYGMFERNLPEESLEFWALTGSTAQGSVFEASNRFFTSKRDAPDMESVPISPLIDPLGILETLKRGGFVYGEENEVYYYRLRENTSGSKRYKITLTTWAQIRSLTKKKCGNREPPDLSSWWHCRSAGFFYRGTFERQEIQDDYCTAIHCVAGFNLQPGKKFIGYSPVILAHEHVDVTAL